MEGPDECLFKLHMGQAPFQLGSAFGKWGLAEPDRQPQWPHVIVWVASHRRFMGEGRIYLRLALDGYPQLAPTGRPWDIDSGQALAAGKWPKGEVNVSKVFKPSWNATALYAPCDRVAMNGHEPWQQQFPHWWWRPEFTFVRYLEFVHDCLNCIHEEAA